MEGHDPGRSDAPRHQPQRRAAYELEQQASFLVAELRHAGLGAYLPSRRDPQGPEQADSRRPRLGNCGLDSRPILADVAVLCPIRRANWGRYRARRLLEGSRQAVVYERFLSALRRAVFTPSIGSFGGPQYFDVALQPSLILNALEHKTRFDYLAGRSAQEVVRQALAEAEEPVSPSVNGAPYYKAPSINYAGEPPVPYSDRGTYIQVIELLPDGPSGKNVLPPGVAESGA